MNAKISHAAHLFHEMMRVQRQREQLQQQLSLVVAELTNEEFVEYVRRTSQYKREEEGTK